MSEPVKAFNWNLIFWRILGGLIIVIMWAVRDGLRHDYVGVTVALLAGIGMVAICHRWVRSDSNKAVGPN